MNVRTLLILAVAVPFVVITDIAVWQHGYVGVLEASLASTASMQVFADLAVALTLVLMWLVPDARARGIAAWPFVLITLALGSLGPLAYLGVRAWRGAPTPSAA